MTEYQTLTTNVPPIVRLINGEVFIEILFEGGTTYRAPIGDGRYFFSQVVAKLVDPALLAAYPLSAMPPSYSLNPKLTVGDDGVLYPVVPLTGFASPND